MKNKLAFLLSILILITACKKQDKVVIDNKVEKQMTLLQVFMKTDGKELKEVFSQGNGTNKKTIFNIADANAKKIFKYIILDANSSKRINLVSEIPLSSSMIDLNSFTETNKIYYIPNNINAKGNTSQSCITAKYNSQSYKLEGDNLSKLLNPTDDICIDWYWTTTDGETGELIGEIYLWTECNTHNGNGGGGGNNGDINNCITNQTDNFYITVAASITDNTFLSTVSGNFEPNSFVKPVQKKWICLKGLGYNLSSIESGKVKLDPTSKTWSWVELKHESINMSGNTLPGVSVSFTQGTGLPSFTPETAAVSTILYAGMQVIFQQTVSSVLSCSLPGSNSSIGIPPVSKIFTSSSGMMSAQP